MLATTPRPPHLLSASQISSSSFANTPRAPTRTMSKTIKGLFSRSKSPEKTDQNGRSRFRSVIGEKRARPATSSGHVSGMPTRPRTLTKEPDEKRHRPPTPEFGAGGQTRRAPRLAPSALPAIQRGPNGKWQPPSLSRGSVSTSALAIYAQGEDVEMEEEGVFQRERMGQSSSPISPVHPPPQEAKPSPMMLSSESTRAPLIDKQLQCLPLTASPISLSPILPLPAKSSLATRRARAPTAPSVNRSHKPANTFQPTHSRATSEPLLSKDHYAIRLSTSYLLKCLIPIIRGSSFVQNDKITEMRRMADERLGQLERMERGWGWDWSKIAVGALDDAGQGIEGKVRAVQVGERTRGRERKVWREAIGDGVLLCFLFNHLFPAQPAHIPRVNISEDGILRATNITRVITACQALNLPNDEMFGLADIQDGSENGLGRVAATILILARLSARRRSANAHQSPSRPPSRNTSHTPPRLGGGSPGIPSPGSPLRPQHPSANQSRRGSNDSAKPQRRGSDASNDLHSKLQFALGPSPRSTSPCPAQDITPPSSGFIKPKVTPTRLQALGRSSTQPNISPLRPKSPLTPTRPGTPTNNRFSQISARPALRPRNTIGARPQVSFAGETQDATSPRSITSSNGASAGPQAPSGSGHGRERTPSLISSGSRVTSGYTRSSVAFSINTVIGDEHAHAVNLAEEEEDGSLRRRGHWERRASEKTLHNARQKILGTLLSSEDLPADLKSAIAAGHIRPYPVSGVGAQSSEDDLRGEAIMRSLDALEGIRTSPSPSVPSSPSRRIQPRRAYTVEPDRTHVQRLSEGDEVVSTSSGSGSEILRPSVIRRVSASGKTYVPKRSASPSTRFPTSASTSVVPSRSNSPAPTPTTGSFPFPTGNPGSREGSVIRELRPALTRMERRQSEILPAKNIYSGVMGHADRVSSMVNLSSVGTGLSREGSSQISATRSGPLQVLDFEEAGMPVVKYQLGNCIGRGQFGSVYRSLNLGTGQMAAIKRIRLHGMKEDEVRDVMHEVELLKRLTHPSIVKYEGMSRDEEYLNIVLEFVENGSLGQTLKAFGNFNERLVSSYVAKILEGLDYLHSQGVVHCDLKAANILSTKNGNVKLSDFGVSLNMKAVENIKQDAATRSKAGLAAGPKADVAGTPNWMAPEVISLNGASPASDIWSLGCTIIELLTGRPPYAEIANSMTVLFRIVEDDMPPIPSVSAELEDFLKLCFIKDPSHRPSAATLFQHPWVRSLDPQFQLLRPQDSVPFLRRVSMNAGRPQSTQLFDLNCGSKAPVTAFNGPGQGASAALSPAAAISDHGRKRWSVASSGHGKEGSEEARNHTFIKTSFGQAIICRICHTNVKKVGVLCQTCGLISHTACASATTSRCDAHEQYILYARQQEYLQSAASSRYVSPQTSNDNLALAKSHQFPAKLLLGIKRSSKSMLRSASSVELAADARRRKASIHSGPTPGPSAPVMADRSYSNPDPTLDRQSSHNSRQSRVSVMSNVSMVSAEIDDPMADGRRRSALRFKLDEGNAGVTSGQAGLGMSILASSRERVYQQPRGKTEKRGKSDCVLQ